MSLMKSIRIGTRNSPLALWQAREVATKLQNKNVKTEIVPIISSGDKNLTQPLYTLGITGIFTKDLDIALLNDEIDIAVHSLKDVPTELPKGIKLISVLERDFPQDVLVRNSRSKNIALKDLKIATSSLRRRAFWLREFPHTEFSDIRGNVQTRLRKLEEGIADATLFSLAGLKRMNLQLDYEFLPFMISSPSQGVVGIAGHEDKIEINDIVKTISHSKTEICTQIERNFLSTLEGGCTAPIGAFAEINENNEIRFLGRICSLDGENTIETDEIFHYNSDENSGEMLAHKVLNNGGKELMSIIKRSL
jgi:hydroxymethylbilane synthase